MSLDKAHLDSSSNSTQYVSLKDNVSTAKELQVHIEEHNLSYTQVKELQNLIGQNREIFPKDASELGKTTTTTTDNGKVFIRKAQLSLRLKC